MKEVCPATVMLIATGHLQADSLGAMEEVKVGRVYFCCDCMSSFTKSEGYKHARLAHDAGEGPINAALTIKAGMR